MRQGNTGGRRPRGRHGGSGDRNNGQNNNAGAPRGEGRVRSAASLRHQTFDSNGPDVRVRGNAWQVCEKYQALARDAQSSGDRVLAENYLQHAEHYYRVTEAIEEATAAEARQRGYVPQSPSMSGQQPEVPSNYYTPDGQLAGQGAAPLAGSQPQPTASQPQPAQAEVQRRTPPATPLTALFASDEPEQDGEPSGPQQLVAGR